MDPRSCSQVPEFLTVQSMTARVKSMPVSVKSMTVSVKSMTRAARPIDDESSNHWARSCNTRTKERRIADPKL